MTKEVKIDDRNRIHISAFKDMADTDLDDGEQVAIHPDPFSAIIYDPEVNPSQIVDSLKRHLSYFEGKINNEEGEEDG